MYDQFPESHFSRHEIVRADRDGRKKRREIFVPDDEARDRHAAMLTYLRVHPLTEPVLQEDHLVAVGGVKGASLLDNVLPHQLGQTFYKVDLKNAFASVDVSVLKEKIDAALEHDRQHIVQSFIAEYGLIPNVPGLPLGAPCSPAFFNFYCNDMDIALRDFCDERGLTYTRWLDDITISSKQSSGVLGETSRRSIRDMIEAMPGMKVNHAKSQLHRRISRPVTITGVSLYPDGRIQPSPAVLESMTNAFNEIEAEVYDPDTVITPYHVARLNGYNGVLSSMIHGTQNETLHEFGDRYGTLVRLAHAAIAMAEEEPRVPDPARKRLVRSLVHGLDVMAARARNPATSEDLSVENVSKPHHFDERSEKVDYQDISEFAYAYVTSFYTTSDANVLSARDFRYAALSLGFELDHTQAIQLVEEFDRKVRLDRGAPILRKNNAIALDGIIDI